MKNKLLALVAAGILAGPSAAGAAVTYLEGPSDFSGPTTTLDFDDVPDRTVINTYYSGRGVRFQRDDGQAIVAADVTPSGFTTASGTQGLATILVFGVNTSYVNHLNVIFDSPTFEIGAYVGNAYATTLSLFDAEDNLLASYAVSDSTRDVDQFLGLRSTIAFVRARFETNDLNLSVFLDDLTFGNAVHADVLIDTGLPTSELFSTGCSWRAGQITSRAALTVNSIQNYVQVNQGVSVSVTLRTDASGLPGTVIFSAQYVLTAGVETFQGPTDLNWTVGPGTYWFTFEYPYANFETCQTSAFRRRLGFPDDGTYPPRPLSHEAVLSLGGAEWVATGGRTGWRVTGSQEGVVVNGKEWRQLTDTLNLSWNQVANVCNTTTGVCSGSIGGVSFDGWRWAANSDVQALFEELIEPGTTNFPYDYSGYAAQGSDDIDAAIGYGGFRPTQSAASAEQALGMTRFSDGIFVNLPNLTNFYSPELFDRATLWFTAQPIEVASPIVGVWLYRDIQTFGDVSPDYWAFLFIEKIAAAKLTGGCGGGNYCPIAPVTRAQMAVFLERGMRGSTFVPPPAKGNVFTDVAAGAFAANFIEQLYLDGITAGCGANKYCPDGQITRAEMAVFLLRAKHGSGYRPPAATGLFSDVPLNHWAVHWIEQLAREGITGGCGGGKYCPSAVVTRDQMAVFLVRTFGL